MSEWIKQLEANAKKWSGNKCAKGSLYLDTDQLGISYMIWDDKESDNNEVYIRGPISSEQLESLAAHMKKYKGE